MIPSIGCRLKPQSRFRDAAFEVLFLDLCCELFHFAGGAQSGTAGFDVSEEGGVRGDVLFAGADFEWVVGKVRCLGYFVAEGCVRERVLGWDTLIGVVGLVQVILTHC